MLRRYPAMFLFMVLQFYFGLVLTVVNIDQLCWGLLFGCLLLSGGVITAHRLYENWRFSRAASTRSLP